MGNWSFVVAAVILVLLLVGLYIVWTVRLLNRTHSELQALQRKADEPDRDRAQIDETAVRPHRT